MIRLRRRRRRGELDAVRERTAAIEKRADRAVDAIRRHGERNRFAQRWRHTLPPKGV